MINSVLNESKSPVKFWILCLDIETWSVLNGLNNKNLVLIKLEEFEDTTVLGLRNTREWREFCWTLASSFLCSVISHADKGSTVAYIDADCFFFDDFLEITMQLGNDAQILIHEHRFSPDRKEWEKSSGRFNVGVIVGIVDEQFVSCITRWREKVLEECVLDPENGKCGDQTYLNDWPDKYSSVRIMHQKGAGIGPWNMLNYQFAFERNRVKVDNENLIFFHFSRFKVIYIKRFFMFYVGAEGYEIPMNTDILIYKKYAKAMLKSFQQIKSNIEENIFVEKITRRKKLAILRRKILRLAFIVSN
jgi:hypothetical protein